LTKRKGASLKPSGRRLLAPLSALKLPVKANQPRKPTFIGKLPRLLL
jgi:hypothetical protein